MTVQEEKKSCTSNEYVDLGLPSGLKWAKCNVGATTETDYGDYFMWGSTKPNTPDECTWEHTPFNNGDSYYNADAFKLMKDTVCPNGILAKEYDAAAQIMGDGWRMPTSNDIGELLTNTTQNQVGNYNGTGVDGYEFTSKINGNSIFIPTAGYVYDGSVNQVDDVYTGNVWSSSPDNESDMTSNPYGAWALHLGSERSCGITHPYRCYGLSVRGVHN